MKKTIKKFNFIAIALILSITSCSDDDTTTASKVYTVTTFAGAGTSGSVDGLGTAAKFGRPEGIAIDAIGNVYVADFNNNKIRKITSVGEVTTFAGSGVPGSADGTGTAAKFNRPRDITIDSFGNLFVTDSGNHNIRKITPAGVVTTFAGSGTQGSADGTGSAASFYGSHSITIDAANNLYVADTFNNKIRKITPAGVVTTLSGSGVFGSADGLGTVASFSTPSGIAIDAAGNLFVTDQDGHSIRKVTATGVVTTFAGNNTSGSADGTGAYARFSYPIGITIDGNGNLYVADYDNNKIRKITPGAVVTTIAGSGTDATVDGVGVEASFDYPFGIDIDATGKLYVSDKESSTIRKIIYQ